MKTKYFLSFLAVFASVLFAFQANAGVFQFSETDPKYLEALSIAAAQEAQEEIDIEKKLELDEDLKPEDFGLTDIGILPTNPFYFVKDIRRGVGSVFTRDHAKKAELKLQYAAEKLLEAKEVAQKEGSSDKDKEYAIENFKDELEEVKHRVEIASESLNDEQSKELSRKVLDSTLKYSKSLGNIEKNVSPELFLHVKEAKDAASEALVSTFGLTEPGIVSNQLTEVLNEQKGSEFKNFKNLEVLKEVESKVPEAAKDAIKNAQANALNRLQAELEKFESAKKAIFEEFVKGSGGSEIRHLEIINELEARPISKDLRDVILGAKEQVFSKAANRLNGLSQENKEKFVEHLGEGNLEDFRILRELKNNIDSGVISGISNVTSRAEAEFVKKIESTGQNAIQKKEFLDSIGRFHDAKSISVLDEIEKLIPNDKKNFFAELKSKAVQEIRNDVGRAANSSQRQFVYDSLAGDHPEDLTALDKFQGTVRTTFDVGAFFEGIKKAQYGVMQDKIESISDKERLAKYEEEFKKLRQDIPDYSRFDRVFERRKDIFESPEKAVKKIEEAEKVIAEFRGVMSSLPYDSAYKEGGFDNMLRDIESILAHAERKLETARTVLSYNDVGRAFGEAQSAESIARNGIALAAKYKSGVKDTKCPFYFPPPQDFCQNGAIVHQTDQNGCPLPPRCEFKEIRECPSVDYSTQTACPSGTHRDSFKDNKGCYVLGKCVPDKVTCQAYFEGYIFDKSANSCRKESTSGCSDPFIYHTLDECTKASTRISICPAMPTVTSCPTGEHKIVTFSSPECGIYYSCEKDTIISAPQCSDGKDNDNDGQIDYPADTGCYGKEDYDEAYYPPIEPYCRSYSTEATCKSSVSGCVWYANHHDGTHCDDAKHGGTASSWVEHFWKFKDGLTERSMILNRTDGEYLTFISGIEKQCLTITKDKFAWKSGAGNDSSDNWQNFGIPDCSGSATVPIGPGCGNHTTSAVCESYTSCDWVGTSCVPTTTILVCDNNGVCDSAKESPASCPADCTTTIKPQCSDGKDNDGDGKIDYPADTGCYGSEDYDETMPTTTACNNNKICDYGESPASCPTDCTSTTSRCTYFTEATCNADTICAWVGGFGCGSKAQCNDKVDNDGDKLIDMADSGCAENFDNDESNGSTTTTKPQCSDGKDNDGDGKIDYPADTGCYGSEDYDETMPTTTTACTLGWHQETFGSKSVCVRDGSVCSSTSSWINQCPAGEFKYENYNSSGFNTGCPTGCYADAACASTSAPAYCYSTQTNCASKGYYWCSSNSQCYGSSSGCPTTTTTTCNNNGTCDSGESAASCPADCGSTTTVKPQCSDGKDNDGDGKIDYPADTGCYGSEDNDETMPTTTTTCNNNGICDSGEAVASCADCSTTTVKPQCSDGKDNDNDGQIDYPADKSCYDGTDNDEAYPATCTTASACTESIACSSSGFYWYNAVCNTSPQTTTTTCNNNGTCDSGEAVASCQDCSTTTTKPQCSDGKDNDGDGKIDYPADTGCYDGTDNDEATPPGSTTGGIYEDTASLCSDGKDNDNDGFIDHADPSCSAFTTTTPPGSTTGGIYEDTASLCSDGIDNDNDGFIDKADPSCSAFTTTTTGSGCGSYTSATSCGGATGCVWHTPSTGTPYCMASGGASALQSFWNKLFGF